MTWSKIKLSDVGYANDAEVYNAVGKNIGPAYSWNAAANIGGGKFRFKYHSIGLVRVPRQLHRVLRNKSLFCQFHILPDQISPVLHLWVHPESID